VTWWGWLLLWTVLVAGAVTVHFLLGRRLWRQIKALTRELRTASEALSSLGDRLAELEAAREPAERAPGGVGSTHPGSRPLR
jgi:hypothetical protein